MIEPKLPPEQTPEQKPRLTLRQRKEGLYDKIKIPIKTLDLIIYGIVGLIILALILGMAIGNG